MKRFNLNTVPAVGLALATFAGFGNPVAAQESAQTFRACLVPQVGAMYLIGLEGLPAECLSGEHREISWTEGGVLENGSVGSEALQDASVTTAKIAPAAITTAEIADGAVQSAQIVNNAITSSKIAPESVSGGKLRGNSVDGRVLDLRIENVFQDFDIRPRLSADVPSSGVFSLACPSGKEVLTGGFQFTRAFPGMVPTVSRPRTGQTAVEGWVVHVRNTSTRDGQVRIHLVCADLR